jgi:tetratricopeptide (TPR) repeat protein
MFHIPGRRKESDTSKPFAGAVKRARNKAVLLFLLLGGVQSMFADGLPLQYLLSNEWRNIFIASSPLSNPAFMTEENYATVRGVYAPSFNTVSRLWEVGLVVPVGLYRSIGASLVYENGLPIDNGYYEGITFHALSMPVNNDNAFGMISWADNVWKQFSYGVNLNILRQSNFGDPCQGMGLDAGVSYRILNDPVFGYHVVGVCAHNFLLFDIAPAFSRISAAQLDGTLHSSLFDETAQFDMRVDLTDLWADRDQFLSDQKIEWNIFLQGGVWLLRTFSLNAFAEYGQRAIESWGMAVGANVPGVNNGRDLAMWYQVRSEVGSDLGLGHSIYLRCQMGQHREDWYARRLAQGLSVSPNDLYNRALRLYYAGEYWQAYFIFARIKTDFPTFFKNDYVQHYKGACLEKLDFREAAIDAYDAMLTEFPHSQMVPNTELGMQRVYYREGDDDKVAERYRSLISMNREVEATDSLKYHAAYLMGQSAIRTKSYGQALQVLPTIRETHPDYLFAQHSMGIAVILHSNDPLKGVEYFEKCVNGTPKTAAEKEIVNRSCVFLGYIFYGQGRMAAAVSSLRLVPPESIYYTDALLGLAWAAYRAHNVDDCVTTGMLLANAAIDPILKCQGLLIQASGLAFRKDYDNAQSTLKTAQERMAAYTAPSQDSASLRKEAYETDRNVYRQIGEAMVQTADAQAEGGVARGDTLRVTQMSIQQRLDDYLRYDDIFNRMNYFHKDAAEIKNSIDYVMAQLMVAKGESSKVKDMRKAQDQINSIDREIQDMQQKLPAK